VSGKTTLEKSLNGEKKKDNHEGGKKRGKLFKTWKVGTMEKNLLHLVHTGERKATTDWSRRVGG